MAPLAGTFLANVRGGSIQFPTPLRVYCDAEGWDLFRIVPGDRDRLLLEPVLASDPEEADTDLIEVVDMVDGFNSSLSADGKLWIPAELRDAVGMQEQSVLMRVEGGGIGVYLRKVFDTLGFGP
jgi:hypothetical protein